MLIAIGACATIGGVNKLKNAFDLDEVRQCVYGEAGRMEHLDTTPTKAVDEVVKVDYKVHGCPMNPEEFTYVVRCLLMGKTPEIPDYPVCVECKMKENVCRWEYDEICLGPITRAGCGAKCPSASFRCFGCRGYIDDPNITAAKDVMDKYDLSVEALRSKMVLFGSKQGPTYE